MPETKKPSGRMVVLVRRVDGRVFGNGDFVRDTQKC